MCNRTRPHATASTRMRSRQLSSEIGPAVGALHSPVLAVCTIEPAARPCVATHLSYWNELNLIDGHLCTAGIRFESLLPT